MKLRIPTSEALRDFYNTHMKAAFPPAELKPLSAIERMWRDGWYKPYCLYDDDGTEVVGCAFLWLGHDGWGLLDYLCVCAARRNDGLGAVMLRLLPETEPGMVIFGEAEAPTHAPTPPWRSGGWASIPAAGCVLPAMTPRFSACITKRCICQTEKWRMKN